MYSASDVGAEYYDERVCLFVSPRSYLENYTSDLHQIFYACYCGHGLVLLWRRSDSYFFYDFMDDIIFAHKLRLFDIAARLRQRGSHVRSLGLGA